MRLSWMLGAGWLAVVAASCGDAAAAKGGSDGALVLEVGGDQSSLREALRAAGVLPSPAPAVETEPANPPRGEPPAPRAEADPVPVAPPQPTELPYFTVELGANQTLIHLARKHLGNGNRFREILELNGWTENDARRLREGQQVKIPRVDAPAVRR